jgi:hypothetical protein
MYIILSIDSSIIYNILYYIPGKLLLIYKIIIHNIHTKLKSTQTYIDMWLIIVNQANNSDLLTVLSL